MREFVEFLYFLCDFEDEFVDLGGKIFKFIGLVCESINRIVNKFSIKLLQTQ